MYLNNKILSIGIIALIMLPQLSLGAEVYGNFPVTEKSYSGSKKDSTSYTGQMARHVLHNSLKKLAGKGNGKPNLDLKAKMLSYYAG